jgi:hypothetical protein
VRGPVFLREQRRATGGKAGSRERGEVERPFARERERVRRRARSRWARPRGVVTHPSTGRDTAEEATLVKEPDTPCRRGSPRRRPSGAIRTGGHRTSLRFGAGVAVAVRHGRRGAGAGTAAMGGRSGGPEGRSEHRGAHTPPARPGAFRSEHHPHVRRRIARSSRRAVRGSREPKPQGREWLKQVTGSEEGQAVKVVENGEGGPKRAWNPATR